MTYHIISDTTGRKASIDGNTLSLSKLSPKKRGEATIWPPVTITDETITAVAIAWVFRGELCQRVLADAARAV